MRPWLLMRRARSSNGWLVLKVKNSSLTEIAGSVAEGIFPSKLNGAFDQGVLSIVWWWLRTRQRCIRSVNFFVNLLCGQSVRVGIVPLFQVYLVVAPLFNRFFPGLIGLLRVLPVRLPARIVVWFLFAHGSIRRPTIKMSRAVCATDGSIIWLVAIKPARSMLFLSSS